MKKLIQISTFLFLLGATACSGDKAAESQVESDNPKSAQAASNDLTAAMNQAQEAIKQAANLQEGEPLNFRDLQAFLPEKLDGLERTNKSGQTNGAMGFKISQAEGTYQTSDGKKITISIFDTGGLQMGLMSMAAWANLEMDKEDEKGYERTSTFNGFKAIEKYTKRSNNSELSLLVNNRFIVKGEGRDVPMTDLKAVMEDISLDRMK
ncbi:MAG: hypothetical protein R2828_17540 [Saprospiraceae bacterium]